MSERNDGGPAFQHEADYVRNDKGGFDLLIEHHPGMTLRDWFAGQALTGIVYSLKSSGITERDIPKMATDCYFVADAMLKAREQ
jgi:hypothetical protein